MICDVSEAWKDCGNYVFENNIANIVHNISEAWRQFGNISASDICHIDTSERRYIGKVNKKIDEPYWDACPTEMEAEYIAMSTVCRVLIPLRDLLKEVALALDVRNEDIVSMHTTIWEDNVGALTLANLELPRMTPRLPKQSIA